MRSRYDLAQDSTTVATDGSFYKDICSIPTHKFRFKKNRREYNVNAVEVIRLDIFAYNIYGVAELEDLVLWLNGIDDPTSMTIGQSILIPVLSDVEQFYYNNRV